MESRGNKLNEDRQTVNEYIDEKKSAQGGTKDTENRAVAWTSFRAGASSASAVQAKAARDGSFRRIMSSTAKVAPATGGNRSKEVHMVLSAHGSENAHEDGGAAKKKKNEPSQCSNMLAPIFLIMEGRGWSVFITGVTIYALFGDDLRTAAFAKSSDNAFYVLSLLSMIAFLVELLVFTLVKAGYYRSFYFWLDLVATVTMFTDIGFLWNPILLAILGESEEIGGTVSSSSQGAINAIRDSSVGTKSTRVIRIVRLVRLVRVVKLYKASKGKDALDEHVSEENPSLVGKKLSDKTMQRVITVVLSMLISVQFLDPNMHISMPTRGSYGIYRLSKRFQLAPRDNLSQFNEFLETEFKDELQDYTSSIEEQKLIYITIAGAEDMGLESKILNYAQGTQWQEQGVDPSTSNWVSKEENSGYTPTTDIELSEEAMQEIYRSTEYESARSTVCFDRETGHAQVPFNNTCFSAAFFDITDFARFEAWLNICRTILVMIVLTVGSLTFSNDAEKLVIRPIERMVVSVKKLAENPMGTSTQQDLSLQDQDGDDETVLLQRTITKIGQLLQIGFGEAGAEIIAMNMTNNSGIEPMCDGVKIEAVFGFCDIRNFTDTTECLQEKVMIYVNKVGSIVHEATHDWFGAANKNIGDAFLLVWKVSDSKRMLKAKNAHAGNMCDNALIAFLRSIIDLKRENAQGGCLHEYKDNAAIRKRFGEGNFEIRLGMGLHIGWAIEGTIGSRYKIDASYLSPNVNMAARLEAATKQFRTPLLLSEDFFDALSAKARKRCRQIDKVTVKGSLQPMGLFTCDIFTYPQAFGQVEYFEDGTRKGFDFDGPEMDAIHLGMPEEFLSKFKIAIGAYLDGHWDICKSQLEGILEIRPEDGPTVSLLEVLARHDYKAPETWKGYRELTEK